MKSVQKLMGLVLVVIAASVRLSAAEEGFHLAFKGGTPQELVQEMRKAVAGSYTEPENIFPINALIPKELESVQVPALTLRTVTPQAVFNALNALWRTEGLQWSSTEGKVWVLQRVPDQRRAQAFFVGHLVKKYTIEDITTAVKTTWDFGGERKHDKPELKYHKDTEMLIALADRSQLATMTEVLSQLKMGLDKVEVDPAKKP